jgi:Helicase conserved C-terminal domain
VKSALKEHRGNQSVMSVALNALLLYPDRPFRLGNLFGWEYDPETQRREKFLIAETRDLDEEHTYAKERRLVAEVKVELARGRRCQIYAVYTQKRDVTRRLERILADAGIRVAVLTTEVPPEAREAWYERQIRAGVQAVICHPKLVQTGLDLIEFPTILFYETGYSIYVLRQASRRSWRIGQRAPVKVKFLHYAGTMQETCLRLMGKKLLVSLAMEGKFSSEGLQAINDDDDILMAMARELVTEKGIGERADIVWAGIQKKQEEVFGVRISEAVESVVEATREVGSLSDDVPVVADQETALRPSLESVGGKNPQRGALITPEGQLSLF